MAKRKVAAEVPVWKQPLPDKSYKTVIRSCAELLIMVKSNVSSWQGSIEFVRGLCSMHAFEMCDKNGPCKVIQLVRSLQMHLDDFFRVRQSVNPNADMTKLPYFDITYQLVESTHLLIVEIKPIEERNLKKKKKRMYKIKEEK